jgi:uncharacterized protein
VTGQTGVHHCAGVQAAPARELISQLRAEPWLMRAVVAVADSGLPDAWIGAGAIRDVIWGRRGGRFDPATVRDVDVVFFDTADLSPERDQAAQRQLEGLLQAPWEAVNQAAVHTWYDRYFGGDPVPPFARVHDAVATWPEFATCVAVRLGQAGLEVCAPHGLDDLLGGVWRTNPARVSAETATERLARQRGRWSGVRYVEPAQPRAEPGQRIGE